jgi:hypothetical protein
VEDRRRLKQEADRVVAEAGKLDAKRLVELLEQHCVDARCYDLHGSNLGEQYVVDHSTHAARVVGPLRRARRS